MQCMASRILDALFRSMIIVYGRTLCSCTVLFCTELGKKDQIKMKMERKKISCFLLPDQTHFLEKIELFLPNIATQPSAFRSARLHMPVVCGRLYARNMLEMRLRRPLSIHMHSIMISSLSSQHGSTCISTCTGASATGWFYGNFPPASTDFLFSRLDLSSLGDGGYHKVVYKSRTRIEVALCPSSSCT